MAPVPATPLSAHTLLETLPPTRTLHPRQTQTNPDDGSTVTIITGTNTAAPGSPDDANDADTLSGGAIAGIVLGSIAGFLLFLWIVRSCSNLGAPPGDEAVPGRPWYGGVRDEYREPRYPSGGGGAGGRGRSRGRSRSGSRNGGYYGDGRHHHHHHHHGRRNSGYGEYEGVVPVQEVAPVVVREGRRSRSRGYYGYGEEPVSRSRSRGKY
ncbi:uncharacterized protein B0H64DRAFT_248620 [Chaetomium fimeti]|uniref:Uncharacterized protein n=1 Tax=Chaetomium fimeti TaxID=1854472 RepID=A0AAE0LNP6_9PEZI|nr:hypothetical protein B0H64DRAFT_248620 [Chaetomium fimeti]